MGLIQLIKKFKKNNIAFLDRPYKKGDQFLVRFTKPDGFSYQAGQHGLFTVKNKRTGKKKTHMFSLASCPEEDFLMLGTKVNEPMSEYKEALLALKEGDKATFRGLFGSFVFRDQTSPVVMIALGLGVTPIRSLLMSNTKANNRPMHLVYSAIDGYLFEEELKELSNVHLQFTKTIDETTKAYLDLVSKYENTAYYYISGSPKAVHAIKKMLKEKGINKKRIIHDPFHGYKG